MTRNIRNRENSTLETFKTILHHNFSNILFENKHCIKKICNDIIGLYNVEHFAITIINNLNEAVAFSTKPDIEYNLINKDLWRDDCIFLPQTHQENTLIWWDADNRYDVYEEIRRIKLITNRFTHGMTINRLVDEFCFLYSFATKSKGEDIQEYYLCHKSGLIDLGDYFYKCVRDIYMQYCEGYMPPKIGNLISRFSHDNKNSYLKLVVSNSI